MIIRTSREFHEFENRRILVTGSSGFIGAHLIELAEQLGLSKNFLAIDKVTPAQKSKTEFRKVDCKNYKELELLFRDFKPDIVIHLAARTDLIGKNISDYEDNTLGSENILKLSHNAKLIAASSRLVFDPHLPEPENPYDYSPTSWYGESKVIMEKHLNENSSAIIVRPTSIWGPRCGQPFEGLIKNISRGTYFQCRDIQVIKTLGYVKNTCYQLLEIAALETLSVTPINLGDGNFDMSDFSNRIAIQLGVRKPKLVNYRTLKNISRIGTRLNQIGLKVPLNLNRFENIYRSQTYSLELINTIIPKLLFDYAHAIEEFADWGRQR
jgi:nucleoside-diphosphate-sugar epimerase